MGHGLAVGSDIFLSYLSDTAPTGVMSLSLIRGPVQEPGFWKVSNLEGMSCNIPTGFLGEGT